MANIDGIEFNGEPLVLSGGAGSSTPNGVCKFFNKNLAYSEYIGVTVQLYNNNYIEREGGGKPQAGDLVLFSSTKESWRYEDFDTFGIVLPSDIYAQFIILGRYGK